MSDRDFNFKPPPRREAKKAFEPPPWEQDQFEELARRKEAEQAADEALGAAVELPAVQEPPEPEQLVAPNGPSSEQAAEEALGKPPAGGSADETDPRIDIMLAGLRKEEPAFGQQIWKVSLGAGAVLLAVGSVLTVWGLYAFGAARRAGAVGALGGGILVAFGIGFASVGAWMVFKTLREQGVL